MPQDAGDFTIGATMADFNADGLVDLFRNPFLYLQQADGHFLAPAGAPTVPAGEPVFGAVAGDYDADGLLDLFYINLNQGTSRLYRNHLGLGFDDVTAQSNLDVLVAAQGSAWLDYDADGRLDLYVADDFGEDQLFHNVDGTTFEDVSQRAGVANGRANYGVAAADYDRDGDIDIFVAPCHAPEGEEALKSLLRNNGDGTFTDVGVEAGVADPYRSWGVVWLDYDNDGWLDVYVVNGPDETMTHGMNRLYRNLGDGTFADVTLDAGVGGGDETSNIGVATADFDNDGWIDIIVASQLDPPNFYHNNGDGTFSDLYDVLRPVLPHSIAVTVGDVNNDGWIDFYQPFGEGGHIAMNDGGTNHWFGVRARGMQSNRFGVGTRITIFAGGMMQVREITAGDGMTSQNHDLSAHFGLGTASRIDSMVVRWPSGLVQHYPTIGGDRTITLVEGFGTNQPPEIFHLTGTADENPAREGDVLRFAWDEAVDFGGDFLTYSLHILGEAGLDTTITDLHTTSVDVPVEVFDDGTAYRWTVSVTDGLNVRNAVDRFAFTFDASATAAEDEAPLPEHLQIASPYPNPFRDLVRIGYTLGRASRVRVTIYDARGRRVRVFPERSALPGSQELRWDGLDDAGSAVGTGLYFVRIEAGTQRASSAVLKL